jgi:photosystem II stability/assembly factor-like uncharacterized protein
LTWHTAVRGLASRGVTALLADPSGAVWAGTEEAGVFRSDNGGRRWSPAGTGIESQTIGALAQAPRQPSLLLAGSGLFIAAAAAQVGSGIFHTTSNGARWAMSASGPDSRSIDALVADPVTGGLLTAADRSVGVFRSPSGGAHWRNLDAGLAPANPRLGTAPAIVQIVGDTELSGEVYALGLVVQAPLYVPVLYQHGPAPATPWRLLTSLPAHCFGPLAAGAQGQLFVGGFTDQGRSVCASDDAGATWKIGSVGSLVVTSIAVAPSNPSRVYASEVMDRNVPPGPTLYRSDDGGASWTGVGTMSASGAHGLAVDPLDQDLVYAAADSGVQRSRDGGVTSETLLPEATALVRIDPRASNTLYAAPGDPTVGSTPPSGVPLVRVSDDGGATWSPLDAGLPPNVPVVDLAFDAADPALLYAATAGGGIFSLQRVP